MNERESQEQGHQAAPGTGVASRASEVSDLEAGAAPTEQVAPSLLRKVLRALEYFDSGAKNHGMNWQRPLIAEIRAAVAGVGGNDAS